MIRVVAGSDAAVRLSEASRFIGALPPATEALVLSSTRVAAGRMAVRGLTPISQLSAQASAAHVAYRLAGRGELPYLALQSSFATLLTHERQARQKRTTLHLHGSALGHE